MKEDFDRAMSFLRSAEGWKSDDKADPGGRTVCGISARSFPNLVNKIWDLPEEEAWLEVTGFYLRNFWLPAGCDDLPSPLDCYVFDAAVNMGQKQALEMIQEAGSDPCRYLLKRIGHYVAKVKRKPDLKVFFLGWIDRTLKLFTLMG